MDDDKFDDQGLKDEIKDLLTKDPTELEKDLKTAWKHKKRKSNLPQQDKTLSLDELEKMEKEKIQDIKHE